MVIRAVVFDIGGVLELGPDLEASSRWEPRLNLAPGELDQRLASVWEAGSLGLITDSAIQACIQSQVSGP